MTLEEAQKVARIVGTADGGCRSCCNALVDQLNKVSLGFRFTRTDEWHSEQPDWSNDPADAFDNGYIVTVEEIKG